MSDNHRYVPYRVSRGLCEVAVSRLAVHTHTYTLTKVNQTHGHEKSHEVAAAVFGGKVLPPQGDFPL